MPTKKPTRTQGKRVSYKTVQGLPKTLKARKLTKKELDQYKELKKILSLNLTEDNKTYISKLYASIFKQPVFISISNKPIYKMIERIDIVVDNYK